MEKCAICHEEMNDMSEERKVLLRMFGAELIEVDEGDFDAAILLPNY